MKLRDKTFTRMDEGCEASSPRPNTASGDNGLFASDWEVFVIKHDKTNGKHTWFTLCCELADAMMHRTATADS